MTTLFYVIFAVVSVSLIVQMIRHGGMTGAMLGARMKRELGKIEGKADGGRRITLGVRSLEGARPVGIHFTGRSAMSVERMAASLSRTDARRLAEALETAAEEADER